MTLKVFLVEDNPVIRHSLSAALEELAPVQIVGFAEDEQTATEWLRANGEQCDLLIVDIFLNRGSGLGVLRTIQNQTPICKVVMSNYATEDMRRKCLELGAHRVFDKSNEFEALAEYCTRLEDGETGPGKLDSRS
jgi:DNA-binding NarL/FixJ family response regulator